MSQSEHVHVQYQTYHVEYFRDELEMVMKRCTSLITFSTTRAGSEVSALLDVLICGSGYQPILAKLEMGAMQDALLN
jgi:F0F1-type ATP synthase beta subunit